MLSGKEPKECSICYEQEKAGAVSKRMQSNSRFAVHFGSQEATQATLSSFDLKFLDLRFSNVCNQKCRTCGPVFSTGWYADHETLTGIKGSTLVKISDRANTLDEFLKHATALEAINFAGGEPLLTSEHYDALEHLLAVGNTDAHLTYNTNMSVLELGSHDVVQLWKKFSRVTVGVSIDDVGARAEYIRSGAKWATIEDNIKRVKRECPHIKLYAAVTVSAYNVLHLRQMYYHLVQSKLFAQEEFFISVVREPFYLSVSALPENLIARAKEEIFAFMKAEPHLSSGLKKVMERLDNPNGETEHLISFTRKLDEIRSEDVTQVIPELQSIF